MPPRALTLREGKAPVRDRLLTMLFLAACLTLVWWIFRTGYRLKS